MILKAPGLFSVSSVSGDIDANVDSAHGLYFHDTRYLRQLTLTINGKGLPGGIYAQNGRVSRFESSATGSLRVARDRSLGHEFVETVTIENCGSKPTSVSVRLRLASHFEHIFEVRSPVRRRNGSVRHRWEDHHMAFSCDGLDGRTRNTTITFDPLPDSRTQRGGTYRLRLLPHAVWKGRIRIMLSDLGPGDLEVIPAAPGSVPAVRGTIVESSNADFDRVMRRAFSDLQMLATRQQGESFFAAGVPWFVALFGRDSLITAFEMLAYQPTFAADSLRLLGRYQGRVWDAWREEAPGKIPHEVRTGERANVAAVPHGRYYGSVDATPLFVLLLAEYLHWTNDRPLWHELRSNASRALDWMDGADEDGDGFVEYRRRSPKGLINQGWKDSWNAIPRRDGTVAVPPIALVEVQAYVYAARLAAAPLFRMDGDEERARRLEAQAARLRRRFQEAYWLPARETFALAFESGGRPVETSSSNAGHALWSGIAAPEQARALTRTLLSRAMFSGWGIRTLSANEVAYKANDYQVGAVWPHDTAIVHAGLRRYEFDTEAEQLFTAMYEAALAMPDDRLPELFAGYSRTDEPRPIPYPDACTPQAWAAAALPFMLQTMLGLAPDAANHELHIVRPRLPPWLEMVVLRELRVGNSVVDLRFQRSAEDTRVVVLRNDGGLRIR